MRRAHNAERDGNQKLQHHSHKRDPERDPHVFADHFGNGQLEFERHTEISSQRVSQPLKIPFDNSAERVVGKAVQFLDVKNLFFRNLLLRQFIREFQIDIVVGQAPHKPVNRKRHYKKYK